MNDPGATRRTNALSGGPALAFGVAVLLVFFIRLWQCIHVPYGAGDLLRQLGYAVAVKQQGLAALAQPLSSLFPPGPFHEASWAAHPYNYPPGAIGFFTLVAMIHPSIFALKFALTAVEAGNAVLVARCLQMPWAGLCYWASPLSIWWVSREGQFEPVQTLPLLLAMLASARSPVISGLLLACAVQVKVLAILALPWWLWETWRQGGRTAVTRSLLGFGAGLVPSALFCAFYPMLAQIASTGGGFGSFNPWHWEALLGREKWWWPDRLIAAAQVSSLLSGFILAWLAWRTSATERGSLLAPAGLWLASKFMAVFQPWYWLLLQGLAGGLVHRRTAALLGLCALLLDPLSLWQLTAGPSGPVCFPQDIPPFTAWTTPSHP